VPVPAYVVYGFVLDAATKGVVVGARVELDGMVTTSDEDGYFRFDDVKPGTYTLTVTADGYQPYSATLTVEADVRHVVYLQPVAPPPVLRAITITLDKTRVNVGESFTVSGQVTEDGKPVVGVDVYMAPEWFTWTPTPPIKTDAYGRFTVTGVCPSVGTYSVYAFLAKKEAVSNYVTLTVVSPYAVSLTVTPTRAPYDQPTTLTISGKVDPPPPLGATYIRLWRQDAYEFVEARVVEQYPPTHIVTLGVNIDGTFGPYRDTWIPKYETIVEDKWARAYARKYRAELVDAETGADLAWSEQVVVYAG